MSTHVTTMHAHSPASYSISLVIHGAIALAIALSAYMLNDATKKTSEQIIVLVAGEGNNYMATEAPAPGSPESVSYQPSADPPRPVVEPEPIVAPVQETPVTPVPREAIVVPPTKQQPKTQPKKTAEPKTVEPKTKQISKADFDKLNADKNKNMPSNKVSTKKTTTNTKPVVAPIIGKGLSGGVAGGTGSAAGAGGNALTAGERDQMEAYFALLAQRIKEAQEKPEGLSNSLVVRIEFQVAASGSIGAVKIIRSSGNRAFDDSVLKAIRTVRPIGPRPDGRSGARLADFYMREED